MKYMLLMMGPAAKWQEFLQLRPEELRAHHEFMNRLNDELSAAGELVEAQGLAFPDQAKVVRTQPGGEVVVTDGPFPETKEFLAGYWIVDVADEARALAVARAASAAPGAGGAPVGQPIEVRQVMSEPEVEM